jgi:acetyltransferase-like isoleucine patch superfamily enzyme
MVRLSKLAPYADENGNRIEYDGPEKDVRLKLTGRNNHLVVAPDARLGHLVIDFDCDNGYVQIGPSSGVPPFTAAIRVGQDSRVIIGRNVSATTTVAMSATEGTTITVGEDVMFASENQVRADDGHPIFDVHTGQRVNVSRSIHIGNHVWVARGAVLLGGALVGDGSVIGYGSIVTKAIPNNCIAAGIPARVVRRDIAWERPHLSLVKPYYKPDASTVTRSPYWNVTRDDGPADTF